MDFNWKKFEDVIAHNHKIAQDNLEAGQPHTEAMIALGTVTMILGALKATVAAGRGG